MDNKISLIIKLFITYAFILAICFLIYALVILPTNNEAEKVNAIIGLLGWSATLFTPIAAFILLDSWKHQIKYNARLEQTVNVIDELSKLSQQINKLRNDPEVFLYLYKLFLAYEDPNESEKIIFRLPDFSDIFQTLENIRVCNLKIYIYDENMKSHIFQRNKSGQESYKDLEKCINDLEACFFSVKMHREPVDRGVNSPDSVHHLQNCLYISSTFSNAYMSSIYPYVDNIFLNKLNDAIERSFEDIKTFRKLLR